MVIVLFRNEICIWGNDRVVGLMNIVFAHFGKNLPRHLIANLNRCVELFPEHTIYLIADSNKIKKLPRGVKLVKYKLDASWNQLEISLSHPLDFRDGFWIKSLGRFFALKNFMEAHPGPILHVESDVLIAKDFPFIKLIECGKDIAFPVVSSELGIASTLYMRNLQTASYLGEFAIRCCQNDRNSTDMKVLGSLWRDSLVQVEILPTAPSAIHALGIHDIPPSISKIDSFKGYFDGLDFGYYLFGVDPRNNRGFLLLKKKLDGYFIDTSKAKFAYNPNREFPDLIVDDCVLPLFSLHIHSKLIKIFKSQSPRSYFRKQIDDYGSARARKIIFLVMIRSIIGAAKRRMRIVPERAVHVSKR